MKCLVDSGHTVVISWKQHQASWRPCRQGRFVRNSSAEVEPPSMGATHNGDASLGDAPGTYTKSHNGGLSLVIAGLVPAIQDHRRCLVFSGGIMDARNKCGHGMKV